MKLRRSQARDETAHSLPEALIAALIVGTMLVSLYAGFSSGFTIVQTAREEQRATQIILGRLEAIRLYTWTQLQDTNKFLRPSFTEYFDPTGLTNETSGLIYAGIIAAKTPSSTGQLKSIPYRTNLLEVTVKVYWTNYVAGQEVLRSKQMQTYVARYGMQNYLP